MVVQKYLHDLDGWNALPVEEQERAIGRTKLSDLELPDDVKPANSHVALNTIVDEDGEERQIVRLNMPFGGVGAGEFGTYFIGYARDPDVIEQMLDEHVRRQAARQPRPDPRLLDRGHRRLFFVPAADFLDDPPVMRPRMPALCSGARWASAASRATRRESTAVGGGHPPLP